MIWQRTRRRQLEELIRSAKIDFPISQQCLERVTTAIAHAPAPPSARSRRRLVAVLAGAVVLIGLGFVPFPAGSAKGAVARAQAAVEGLHTLHVITRSSYNNRTGWQEEWWSNDGFHRMDRDLDEGWIQLVSVDDPHRTLSYNRWVRSEGVRQLGWDSDHPSPAPPRCGKLIPPRSGDEPFFSAESSRVQRFFAFLRDKKGYAVTERRERRLWFGAIDVIEAQGVERAAPGVFPITCAGGDTTRYRAALDPDTGRLLSLVQYVLMDDGGWKRSYWTRTCWTEVVEWDVEIPQTVRDFQFPPGTTVTERRWWTGRTENVIAEADSDDWTVKLHAIDVNSRGHLYVTLSRWLKPDSPLRDVYWSAMPEVEALDQFRLAYLQARYPDPSYRWLWDGPYWTIILKPESDVVPPTLPRRLTFTVHPYPRGEQAAQSVAFSDVERPGLQAGDDLFSESERVLQY